MARGASGTSLHGDLIELYQLPPKKKDRKATKQTGKKKPPRFEVRKVVKRNTDEFIGVFSNERGRALVNSENSRIPIPFKVMGDTKNAQELDKVLVKFVRWDPPARIPTCKIVKVIGPSNDARTDHKAILAKYGLSQSFPKKVEDEAKIYGNKVSSKDCKGRKDFRKTFTLTIDPLDAETSMMPSLLRLQRLESLKLECILPMSLIMSKEDPLWTMRQKREQTQPIWSVRLFPCSPTLFPVEYVVLLREKIG